MAKHQAEDDFDIIDVTSKMEPVLQQMEQESEKEDATQEQNGKETAEGQQDARRDHQHRRKHGKRKRKKHRHRSRSRSRSKHRDEEKQAPREWNQLHGNKEEEKGVNSQGPIASIPSDSQRAAAPSAHEHESKDLLYVPGSAQGSVAGVGSHNSTMSITTVIHRSKDPAVIVERVKQFLLLYPASVHKKPEEFSIVFDIDETLLYTLAETSEVGLQPVGHALYHFCIDQGFEVVLITARLGDPHSLQYLQEQLHVLEYTGYSSISMVDSEHKHDSDPALCKYKSRIDIGKPVLLNVGNRLCDLFLTPPEDDPLLSQINPQTYYCFKGTEPDILCVKLPTD